MKKIIFLILYFLMAGILSAQSPLTYITDNERPKVIIGLVVENMRPDYIQRYWEKFRPNGFKKLFTQGAVCTNINLSLHKHTYASGTATIFTGVNPSIHGITDKIWYDRLRQKILECTEDDYYITVGSDTKWGNASPKKLLSFTITDNLKLFTSGKAQVFSAAMNRETAIFSAGHAADAAYWFDPESGRMISSSFYVSTFPDWVRNFNIENYPERYSYMNWVTLMPETEYTESIEDDYQFEKGYYEKWNTFPHKLGRYTRKAGNLTPLKTTPYANLIIKDFAIKLMENESLGDDEITDFFTIAFSSMDYKNGDFGPMSVEMEDTYLYLDKCIGEIIDFAENKYGQENVLFFLTANTSASYPVEYLKEEFHFPVDNFSPESAIALLTSYLNITYGQEKWIEYHSDMQIYLDHDLIKKNNIKLNEMREEVSNFINQFEGVQLSLPAHQLEQGKSFNGLLSTLYKSYVKNRSGDIMYMLKEGWQPAYKFKKVNYTDQSQIPLVFYGSGITPVTIGKKHNAIDIVPTLCDLLHIPGPDKCQGSVIKRD